ncbi:hypothetical protein EZS27_009339 [termite gut metagenome]|uniref:Uncharacterized protein n=1 Tax=termite gut metagenome TaxID=433724 RepID=A0A5J4S9Z9_9ZZZZ
MTTENIHLNTGRRKPKVVPVVFLYSINFNEIENDPQLKHLVNKEER